MVEPQRDLVFTGETLSLRPVTLEDADALHVHMRCEELTAFLAWAPHESPAQTAEVIAALVTGMEQDTGYHWVIRSGEAVAGLISLIDLRRRHREWTLNRAELAYWIGLPFQGQGLATAAGREVLRMGFASLGLHKVILMHAKDNPASGKVAEKLGFRYVGEERDAFCKAGTWHNLKRYELLAREHASQRGPGKGTDA